MNQLKLNIEKLTNKTSKLIYTKAILKAKYSLFRDGNFKISLISRDCQQRYGFENNLKSIDQC